MPPTRASAVAGPSRIPYVPPSARSQRRTRRTATQSEASENEDRAPLPALADTDRRQSREYVTGQSRRSVTAAELDHGMGARSTRKNRTTSFASSAPSTRSPSQMRRTRRRPHIRPSLTGPQVEEMTIERRAEMVSDVAGDCLVKLVRAGFEDRGGSKRGHEEWRKAWEGLQSEFDF